MKKDLILLAMILVFAGCTTTKPTTVAKKEKTRLFGGNGGNGGDGADGQNGKDGENGKSGPINIKIK